MRALPPNSQQSERAAPLALGSLAGSFIPPIGVGLWANSVQLAAIALGLAIFINTAFLGCAFLIMRTTGRTPGVALSALFSKVPALVLPPLSSLLAAGWILSYL
jgi:hypothetical protein